MGASCRRPTQRLAQLSARGSDGDWDAGYRRPFGETISAISRSNVEVGAGCRQADKSETRDSAARPAAIAGGVASGSARGAADEVSSGPVATVGCDASGGAPGATDEVGAGPVVRDDGEGSCGARGTVDVVGAVGKHAASVAILIEEDESQEGVVHLTPLKRRRRAAAASPRPASPDLYSRAAAASLLVSHVPLRPARSADKATPHHRLNHAFPPSSAWRAWMEGRESHRGYSSYGGGKGYVYVGGGWGDGAQALPLRFAWRHPRHLTGSHSSASAHHHPHLHCLAVGHSHLSACASGCGVPGRGGWMGGRGDLNSSGACALARGGGGRREGPDAGESAWEGGARHGGTPAAQVRGACRGLGDSRTPPRVHSPRVLFPWPPAPRCRSPPPLVTAPHAIRHWGGGGWVSLPPRAMGRLFTGAVQATTRAAERAGGRGEREWRAALRPTQCARWGYVRVVGYGSSRAHLCSLPLSALQGRGRWRGAIATLNRVCSKALSTSPVDAPARQQVEGDVEGDAATPRHQLKGRGEEERSGGKWWRGEEAKGGGCACARRNTGARAPPGRAVPCDQTGQRAATRALPG